MPRDEEAGREALHVAEAPQVSIFFSIRSQSDEIRQHVARFKAHQQRLIKEREDFAARELKRMRASAFDTAPREEPPSQVLVGTGSNSGVAAGASRFTSGTNLLHRA